jgi:hypothetical protein
MEQMTATAKPQSVLDTIRRRHEELADGVLLDIPVPGYQGQLIAQFARLTPRDLTTAASEAALSQSKSADAQVDVAATLICRHVVNICGVTPDGRHVELDEDDPSPLRFDHRLVRVFGKDPADFETGQQILYAIITPGNESAIIGMARALLEWSSGMSEGVRETLRGESQATLP